MDIFAETTRKERRSLLGAGFAGIVVSFLKKLPTEIDLAGFKFNSPELPLVAVGGLALAITYFWIKFLSSYLYERSNAKTQNLFNQIRDGEIAMDISKKEKELTDWVRVLIDRRKVLAAQIEHEAKRLGDMREKYKGNSDDYIASMGIFDTERASLTQQLRLKRKLEETLPEFLDPGESATSIESKLAELPQRRKNYELKTETERMARLDDLEKERLNIKKMHESEERDIKKDEEIAEARMNTVLEWKQAHKSQTIISPFHRFLELYFPLILGFVSIASLVWLIFHFPATNPITLPGI